MLILQRKPGESIYLNDDTEIIFLGMNGTYKGMRIGIIAPKETVILRDEVYHMTRQKKEFENMGVEWNRWKDFDINEARSSKSLRSRLNKNYDR